MNIQFSTSHQYVFIHQHVEHLLLIWEKETRQELYIVVSENSATLTLQYPGETYRELILDELQPYFFQVLISEDGTEIPVVLGATFSFQEKLVGMYLQKETPTETPYFFFLQAGELGDIDAKLYPQVIQQFRKEFPTYTTD